MGVPCMRAVLRATFAARRRARPTAATNSSVSFFTFFRFMVLFPRAGVSHLSYHTRPKRRLKACNASQSTLKGKARACSGEAIEFFEKQAPRRKRGQFRPQRRKSAGDLIGVHEANNTSVFWQELARECGLTRSVGTGDDYAERQF